MSDVEKNAVMEMTKIVYSKGIAKSDKFKEYAVSGMKERVREFEEAYKKAGDVRKVAEGIAEKLAKGKSEEFGAYMGTMYAVAKESEEEKEGKVTKVDFRKEESKAA